MDKIILRALELYKEQCLESLKYYNSLVEDNLNFPPSREKYLSWSQSKQEELIEIEQAIEFIKG